MKNQIGHKTQLSEYDWPVFYDPIDCSSCHINADLLLSRFFLYSASLVARNKLPRTPFPRELCLLSARSSSRALTRLANNYIFSK